MDKNLSTATPSSSNTDQSTTQDPQPSAAPNAVTDQTENVQQGTASNVLNTSASAGIALSTNNLSSLPITSTTSALSKAGSASSSHHINAYSLSIVGLIFVVAIVLFVTTSRSAKTTTK